MITKRGSQLLRIVCEQIKQSRNASTAASAVKTHDPRQELAMKENCILVDDNDRFTGVSTKRDCHRVDENGKVKLHRAFSVFLFNSDGDMLIQRRAEQKITFPDLYTNACCSHPLYDFPEERDGVSGVRKAAQRRLNYELGIPYEQAKPENFHYITRIQYENAGDGIWGENEIDYILFLHKNVDLCPNLNEVSEVRYIKRKNLDMELLSLAAPLTPWFNLILNFRLKLWWDNLHSLKKFEDYKTITKLG